jgi:predicted RNA-binding protein with PUA-like domain
MKKGDAALIYHTGDEKQVVGLAEVKSNPYPDPKEKDDKLVVFDIKPKKKLAAPVTLADIKFDKTFAGFDLIRIGRLSVVPVPEPMWKRILELSAGES